MKFIADAGGRDVIPEILIHVPAAGTLLSLAGNKAGTLVNEWIALKHELHGGMMREDGGGG